MKPLVFALGVVFVLTGELVAQSTATYTVKFESTWSAATHPTDFPDDPHFSGLVGATHNSNISFWAPGMIASNGIEQMAERGRKTELLAEVAASSDAQFPLSGGGIGTSPNTITYTFNIHSSHSLVTLVSMLAPSPDWFVGVHDLDLFTGGTWDDNVVIPLITYDSGSDNGTTYGSPNSDVSPHDPIVRLQNVGDGNPLSDDDVVGTFTFCLESSLPVEISDFAFQVNDGDLNLSWTSHDEQQLLGYEIQSIEMGQSEWRTSGFVESLGTANGSRNYSFNAGMMNAGMYTFRLRTIDLDGSEGFSELLSIDIPSSEALFVSEPYPNPSSSSIRFISSSVESQGIEISLFDIAGRKVTPSQIETLGGNSSEQFELDLQAIPKGIYFLRVESADRSITKKITRL